MSEALEKVYAVAQRLGIDQAGADKTIERAGGSREALRRLLERERRVKESVLHRHERAEADEETGRRREVFERERTVLRADRESSRRTLSLGARLDRALVAIGALPTGSTSHLQPHVSDPSADDQAPPFSEQLDVSHHVRVIEHHVEAVERELDVARGVGSPLVWRTMTTEQLYAYIANHFPGVHKEDLARDCPEFGSVRSIARARRAHGLRAVDGLPDAKAA